MATLIENALVESVASAIQAALTSQIDFDGGISIGIDDDDVPAIVNTEGSVHVNYILHTATFEIELDIPGVAGKRIMKVQVIDEGRTVGGSPAKADLSKLKGQALLDAEWVLSFKPGEAWGDGKSSGFRANREKELVEAGVLIPTGEPFRWTVGEKA